MTQVIVTLVLEFTEVIGAAGVAGDVFITAPLPDGDSSEFPAKFVA